MADRQSTYLMNVYFSILLAFFRILGGVVRNVFRGVAQLVRMDA